jgi:hypothetical protein
VSVRRPLVKTLVGVAALALLLVPGAVAVATGWVEVTYTPWGEQPGPDPTSIEAWVALALVYVVWAPLVMVALVFAFDRLGYRYSPPEYDPRRSRKERRRREAGMKYLQSREAPPAGAPAARPKRGASSGSSSHPSAPSRDGD